LILSNIFTILITRLILRSSGSAFIKDAKIKAKAIEKDADFLLKDAKIRAKEYEFQHRQELDKTLLNLENDLKEQTKNLKIEELELQNQQNILKKYQNEYIEKIRESDKILEKIGGLTIDEARELIIKRVESEEQTRLLNMIRKYEERARNESEKNAQYILALATTRFAGEFSAERLVNTIKLASDDIKGRIIGKEGRNIKRLESVLGVDIIVDGTPRSITLSSFNLYRRAIAVKTLEKLIDDGRIQPARIEEIHEQVTQEFDRDIQKEGEDVVLELGIGIVNLELIKLIGKLRYRASYGQNALAHSIEVAYLAGMMTAEIGGDEILARRAGLLHDIGKALTHDSSGNHVELGVEVCRKFGESEVVINAIYAHHEYEIAKTVEVATVCAADKLSAGRPGARREVLENSLKRIQTVEDLAIEHTGVESAYAVNSGRELRVIVNASILSDDDALQLSKTLAREIENKIEKFPGDIVVNVIREKRIKSVAKSL
jgi:ribonuclease Y